MIALLLLACTVAHPSAEIPTNAEFEALLRLPYTAFDQDTHGGGYRAVRSDAYAGQILDAYFVQNERVLTPAQARTIHWHAGQRYAQAGLTSVALARFDRALANETSESARRWDAYVRGTMAFLRHDFTALVHAASELKAPPIDPNAKFLNAFLRCFDKSYREAYDPACRAGAG